MTSRLLDRLMGIFTGIVTGYMVGTIIGFTLFDPDLDVWALLGAVLAVAGIGVGLTPWFRRRMSIFLLAILGFYVATLLNILLFGDSNEDLLDALERGGIGILLTIIGTLAGLGMGWYFPLQNAKVPLFAAVVGGFFGGLALAVLLEVPRDASMLELSPYVLISGAVIGGLTYFLQARRSEQIT